jgi:hypothetical protein
MALGTGAHRRVRPSAASGARRRNRDRRAAWWLLPIVALALPVSLIVVAASRQDARTSAARPPVHRPPPARVGWRLAVAVPPQPTFPIRAAFYYGWYPENWTIGGPDRCAHLRPDGCCDLLLAGTGRHARYTPAWPACRDRAHASATQNGRSNHEREGGTPDQIASDLSTSATSWPPAPPTCASAIGSLCSCTPRRLARAMSCAGGARPTPASVIPPTWCSRSSRGASPAGPSRTRGTSTRPRTLPSSSVRVDQRFQRCGPGVLRGGHRAPPISWS